MLTLRIIWLIACVAWVFIGGMPLLSMQELNVISEEFFTFAIGCVVLIAPQLYQWIRRLLMNQKQGISWVSVAIAVIMGVFFAPLFFVASVVLNIMEIGKLMPKGAAAPKKRKAPPARGGRQGSLREVPTKQKSLHHIDDDEADTPEERMRKRYLETSEVAILKIYDKNDDSNVYLDDGEKTLWFEQQGLVVLDGEHYALLYPLVENNDEAGTMVYHIAEDEYIGGITLIPIMDEELYNAVIKAYEEENE